MIAPRSTLRGSLPFGSMTSSPMYVQMLGRSQSPSEYCTLASIAGMIVCCAHVFRLNISATMMNDKDEDIGFTKSGGRVACGAGIKCGVEAVTGTKSFEIE